LIRSLVCLYKLAYGWGLVPSSWKVATIHPVPKKGDLSLICNYRPISLTETLRKVYERIILAELSEGRWAARNRIQLHIAQGGFRERRSALDLVASLQETIYPRKKRLKRWPVLAFLDIKAAYDSVDRALLWSKLVRRGVDPSLMRTFAFLFDSNESSVAIKGMRSERFANQTGLLQGSILSPVLYAVFVDDLVRSLTDLGTWRMAETQVSCFFYADDIAIIADDSNHLQSMLAACDEYAASHSFRFAPSKCEILADPSVDTSGCSLHGTELTRSQSFVYLGVTFDYRGINNRLHVDRLVAKTVQSGFFFGRLGCHGRGHGATVCRKIFVSFIRPQMEYGMQLLPIRGSALKRLESAQHLILTRFLSVHRNTGMVTVRQYMGLSSMRTRVDELVARWHTRYEKLPDDHTFMVREAFSASRQGRSGPRSCFSPGRTSRLAATIRAAPQPVELDELVSVFRYENRLRERLLFPEQVVAVHRWTRQTAKEIRGIPDPRIRRLAEKIALRKAFGQPKPCRHCPGRTSTKHAIECTGIDFQHLLLRGLPVAAAHALCRAYQMCEGLDVADLLCSLEVALQGEYWQTPPTAREDPLGIDASSNRPCYIPPVLRIPA